MELHEILEDNEDAVLHPTVPPGQVASEWRDARAATTAVLTGTTVPSRTPAPSWSCIRTSSAWLSDSARRISTPQP
ncbi:hypothetical protein J2X98_003601 [Pseudarthrobacter enclensis]|uniref:Uncharacterized protein n=1 Tax=Pseudarthrobacter enclensis TaxID=993070 RepID=A0ABT9S0J6_9MICC|nr:hypothetical protein [Pseudarthrobacter enclensis]